MKSQVTFSRVFNITLGMMVAGLLTVLPHLARPDRAQAQQAAPAANHCPGIGSDAAASTLRAANPELSLACLFAMGLVKPEVLPSASFVNIADRETASIEDNGQRAFEAETARYTALANHYATEAGMQQARAAESARYERLANHYATEASRYERLANHYATETGMQQARAAESARYEGLAQAYNRENVPAGSDILAENPELSAVRFLETSHRVAASAYSAANPEVMTGQRYTTTPIGAGLSQQAEIIQQFGLAEYLAAESEAGLPQPDRVDTNRGR